VDFLKVKSKLSHLYLLFSSSFVISDFHSGQGFKSQQAATASCWISGAFVLYARDLLSLFASFL
jgi:hypothetical protein